MPRVSLAHARNGLNYIISNLLLPPLAYSISNLHISNQLIFVLSALRGGGGVAASGCGRGVRRLCRMLQFNGAASRPCKWLKEQPSMAPKPV